MTQCHTGGLGGDDIVPREQLSSERGKKVWSDAGVHLDSAACRVPCKLGEVMRTHEGSIGCRNTACAGELAQWANKGCRCEAGDSQIGSAAVW